MTTIANEIKANILAIFNAGELVATGTFAGKYDIYGMYVSEASIEFGITLSYNYLNELIGSKKMALAANRNKIVACATDMTALRVWSNLAGISIPTHFNYKDGDLTITKNVHPMMETSLELYLKSVKQWIRLLLSDSWTAVQTQDDLSFVSLIYDSDLGYDRITHDSLI